MAFEEIGIRSTQQHRISPNGTSGSFGQVLHLREHVARAAICSSGDWLDLP
jgi:hypothetical protein